MSDVNTDIVIKGGSCEIYFDAGAYEKDPGDHKRHTRVGARIMRVTISDDSHFQDVDTGTHPEGFKGTIRVYCEYD
jgi:hypothetical protein